MGTEKKVVGKEKSILLTLTKEKHVVLYNMANYTTNIATIQISCDFSSNGEKVTVEINRNNPIYEEFVKENLQIFNLSKEENDRWITNHLKILNIALQEKRLIKNHA